MIFTCKSGFSQNSCDTIIWSGSQKLITSDFKAAPDTGKTMLAFTLVKFGYKVIPQIGSAIINTYNYFYPCDSWLNKSNIKNSAAHEQLHFDIAEYHRRLFLATVSNEKLSENMFAASTKGIFKDVAEQRRKMNIEYDIKTKNGQDEQEQKLWNKKISGLISSLDKFKQTTTEIIFR